MALSNDLISQFVKATNDDKKRDKETIAYGEVTKVEYDENKEIINVEVTLDGALHPTPMSRTTDVQLHDRVIVMIKNHTAFITGNITSPSARTEYVKVVETRVIEAANKIDEFDSLIADMITTKELAAEQARIDALESDYVTVNKTLEANSADISDLKADNVTIKGQLNADSAIIEQLQADVAKFSNIDTTYAKIEQLTAANAQISALSSRQANFESATAKNFEAVNVKIEQLEADQIDVDSLEAKFANIDFSNISKATMQWFYANSGLIQDVTVGEGTITGKLVGVTISGDLIEGNTVKAEKLVIKGSDGLYYKLNTDGMKTEAQQTDQNSLNGSIIKAKSITATKISVTDLVAFGATIGGFHIGDHSIYSGTKSSVGNTTRGTYLDDDGQVSFGDSNNFIKFFKDTDGSYKLDISANSILFGANKKSVKTAIDEVQATVDDIEVGGRNLLLGSATKKITPYLETTATTEYGVEVTEWLAKDAIRTYGTGGTAIIFGTMGGTSRGGAADELTSYSATIYVKNNHPTNTVTIAGNHLSSIYVNVAPLEAKRVELIGLGNGWGYLQFNFKTAVAGDEFDITYWHPKIEYGNKPTDWTPAPEDMATGDEVDSVKHTAEDAQTRVASAEALIEVLSESISMLVTDGSGASLMTQTEDGWTFSTAEIEAVANRTSESLNALTDEVGDVNHAVGILQQAVEDLGEIAEYVKIGTYEDEPCIELGEMDSDFKLRITNTRMMFVEGSSVLAYFNNQSLHIKKAVVEEELQQGGFVWKVRSNGNMGLVWKGGTS